jgi:hypothetical protein
MRSKISLVSLTMALLSGCAQLPTGCVGCVVDPKVAYAVARPSPCNDFPVTYRVQVPAERDKVLAVDQVTLHSSAGVAATQTPVTCYAPR